MNENDSEMAPREPIHLNEQAVRDAWERKPRRRVFGDTRVRRVLMELMEANGLDPLGAAIDLHRFCDTIVDGRRYSLDDLMRLARLAKPKMCRPEQMYAFMRRLFEEDPTRTVHSVIMAVTEAEMTGLTYDGIKWHAKEIWRTMVHAEDRYGDLTEMLMDITHQGKEIVIENNPGLAREIVRIWMNTHEDDRDLGLNVEEITVTKIKLATGGMEQQIGRPAWVDTMDAERQERWFKQDELYGGPGMGAP